MSGRAERREHQVLEVRAADGSLILLDDPVEGVDASAAGDHESAHEALRLAVEELAAQVDERWAWVERLTAGLPLPVLVTDEAGDVVEANARLSVLLDLPVHRVLGRPLLDLVAPEDHARLSGLRQVGVRRYDVRLGLRGSAGRHHPATLVGLPEQRAGHARVRWFVFAADHEVRSDQQGVALAEAVAQIAVLPQAYPVHRTRAVLRTAVSFVAALVPGATGSSLTLGDPAAPGMQVSDSAFSQRVDALEVYFAQGPCVDAYRLGETVRSDDVGQDPRWPVLRDRVGEVGLVGAVAVPVLVGERTVGVLNVYAQAGGPVHERSSRVAVVLAAALGALVAVLHERSELHESGAQLREALASRPVIDQAKGIVMASSRCTAEQAFQRLVRHSRTHNVKVRDLAAELVAEPARVTRLA